MISQRVLVLYNEPVLPVGHPDADSEHEVLVVADVVARTLSDAGFDVGRLGIAYDAGVLLEELQTRQADAVFNLFEGLADGGHSEACVAGLLEWQGISFTGSPSQACHLGRNKPLTKYVLHGAGLPTPEFQVVDKLPLAKPPRRWPVIVKPACQDASVGIDQQSVVRRSDLLTERVDNVLGRFGPPVLVERFIAGREFNVSVIEISGGLHVLPLAEIQFDKSEPSRWPIVTYDAKWHPESRDCQATPPHFPMNLDSGLAEELRDLARRAFRLVGCRDYARVDFRVSDAGKPYIIEVNPNPCINPDAGLAAALLADGQTHAQFVTALAHAAINRGKAKRQCSALANSSTVPPGRPSRAAAAFAGERDQP
jgi:D-alanine-D-alanine ligase